MRFPQNDLLTQHAARSDKVEQQHESRLISLEISSVGTEKGTNKEKTCSAAIQEKV